VRNFDVAIRCGYLSTLKGGKVEVEKDRLIGVEGSRIAYVGTPIPFEADETIDASGKWVIPGLVNTHTHLPMTLFRGYSDDVPLNEWLTKHIFPAEARLVDPEFCRLGTELALVEALKSGTTSFLDMYYFEDDIAEVVDRSGMRAWLGQSVIDFPAPDNKSFDGGDYRILDRMVERWKGHERVSPVIAPHAPYTCSDATLKRAAEYGRKHDILLSIHVSETAFEQAESQKNFGKSPTQRLHDIGLMDCGCVFAHCVHVSEADMDLMAKKGVACAHNPESNMKLGSGAAPIRAMMDRGVTVGLGTDGCASNNDLNMIREMDSGAKLAKLSARDNAAVSAADMLRMATWEGAKALRALDRIGSIEEGKLADIVTIDLEHPHLQPVHEVPSLIYSLQGFEVSEVLCHGRVLLRQGRPTLLSPAGILERLREYRGRVGL
jgi:5-methylthioadenosine/S-adenosylhomocysteine deaminase